MMLPPKAGRVCCRSLLSASIVSSVQSAVRPVRILAATRGSRLRPMIVPPPRKISGLRSCRMRATSDRLHVLGELPDARVLLHPDLVHPVGDQLVGQVAHLVAQQDRADRPVVGFLQLARGADDLRHHRGQLPVPVLGEQADPGVGLHLLALEGGLADLDGVVLAGGDAGPAEGALLVDDRLLLDHRDRVVHAGLDAQLAADALVQDDLDGLSHAWPPPGCPGGCRPSSALPGAGPRPAGPRPGTPCPPRAWAG